jgi:alpha/beta superfamily hydrolase
VFALGFPLVRFGNAETLAASKQPRLVVQGEHDEFGAGATVRDLVEALPPPREMVIVEAADHFFNGHLDALQDAVAGWARKRPWET